MTAQQRLNLWKSQLPLYQRIITKCCNAILTPLTRFLPSNFDQKRKELKEMLSIKEDEQYQKYIEVIVHQIEGVKNKSIIQLAFGLMNQFGGSLRYWQNIIVDVAQQISYTNELNVWRIRKNQEQKLYFDSSNLRTYRKICKLSRPYISTLMNLIKFITKFDIKKENMAQIESIFAKVITAEEKYIMVGWKSKIRKFGRKANVYCKDGNRIEKYEKVRNTLLNYKFSIKKKMVEKVSGPTKNIEETNKSIIGQQLQTFQKVLKDITTNQPTELNKLQQLFVLTRNKKPIENLSINLTTIWDRDYYFRYERYAMEMKGFSAFVEPFALNQSVNYEMNSDEEYQELVGQDVGDDGENSEVEEDSGNSFVVSDDYFSDDEDGYSRQLKKPKLLINYGGRWTFNVNDPPTDALPKNKVIYSMVLIDTQNRFPLDTVKDDCTDEILSRMADGRDIVGKMELLSREKQFKLSRRQLKEYLERKGRREIAPFEAKKIVYRMVGRGDSCSVDGKQNVNEQEESEKNKLGGLSDGNYCRSERDNVVGRRVTRQSKKKQLQTIVSIGNDKDFSYSKKFVSCKNNRFTSSMKLK